MNKKGFVVAVAVLLLSVAGVFAQEAVAPLEEPAAAETVMADAASAAEVAEAADTESIKYIAAAIAVGLACIAGGMAVGKIGSAAMGAMSENAELSGKALPFVGLAEGICLWGFLVALLIVIL
ncbi:MAG: ATP synthase subunit C [Treponemataceae bacterium]|nr:ATP synthase subunit C [Treponemataceae bacterium]